MFVIEEGQSIPEVQFKPTVIEFDVFAYPEPKYKVRREHVSVLSKEEAIKELKDYWVHDYIDVTIRN